MLTDAQKAQIDAFAKGCRFDHWSDDLRVMSALLVEVIPYESYSAFDNALVIARGYWYDYETDDGYGSDEDFQSVSGEIFYTSNNDDEADEIRKFAEEYVEGLRKNPQ